jgi:serine/threonine-protein kinase
VVIVDNSDKYIGRLLDNRYEILEKIGTGGMAVVYKARCHRLNRLVAVKILKEELAEDAEFRRRFHTESQAVAMLSHPNIVSVYDVSKTAGVDYIVMELIEGITLKQYINRKGLLGWKESLHFSMQIAKAISHAHSKGIIHRDIKPHNIMVLKDGSIKVADFGIARLVSTANTLTQESLGSVHYISPEQAKGGHVDARTDIYSLGVVMYEMLTSHLPFVGDSAVSVAIQHISSIPLLPRDINPEIPAGLESITMHAMEPKLNARYATADELLRDLEEFRKNPAVVFHYAPPTADTAETGATRPIPSASELSKVEPAKGNARSATPRRTVSSSVRVEPSRSAYRENRRLSAKTTTLIAIAGTLAIVAGAILFMYNYILKDMFQPDAEYFEVRDFVGEVYREVRTSEEYAADYDFQVSENSTYNEFYEEGIIYEQEPKARHREEIGGGKIRVTVYVSLGKRPMPKMPDLTNQDYRAAQNAVNAINTDNPEIKLNLKVVPQGRVSDSVTKDLVIDTIPKAGETLTPNMTISIIYSEGPEIVMVEVPDLYGLTLSAARLELESRNLTPDEPEYVDPVHDEPQDTIVFNTQKNEMVPEHTLIKLQVSNGPKETPTPPPEPTPTETPTDPYDPFDPWESPAEPTYPVDAPNEATPNPNI